MSIKREIAKKCKIKDLDKGRYVKREGWEPNYFETEYGRVSRVNMIGFIVGKDEQSLLFDDGTGTIPLRSFEELKKIKQEVGTLVLVVGKPRSFNEQSYIMPEIIKTIQNPKWMIHRKKELELRKKIRIQETPLKEEKLDEKPKESLIDTIMSKIIQLDQGNGVRISDVIEGFNITQGNKEINNLIEQGEIFEIKPGIVKII